MIIKRLKLERFRKFEDLDLEFSPGINVIRGPNESGKSTIVRAIVAALFERPSATAAKGRLNARWRSTDGPSVLMEFDDAGGRYVLSKDFTSGKVLLEQPDGKPLSSVKAVDFRMHDLLGFRDPSQYFRTACVTHDQMASLGEDAAGSRKIAAMLRETVIGNEESAAIDRALKGISSEIEQLKRGLERPTNNPGTIRRLQEEREAYVARRKDLLADAADLERHQERLAEVEAELEETAGRLADLDTLLEANSRLEDAVRRRDEAYSRLEEAERIHQAISELEDNERLIGERFAAFDRLAPGAEEVLRRSESARESLEALMAERNPGGEEDKGGLEEELERAPASRERRRSRAGYPALVAGAVILLASIVLGVAAHGAFFTLAAAAVLFIVFGAVSLSRTGPSRYAGGVEEVRDFPTVAAGSESPALERAEAEESRLAAEARSFLESVGCADAREFFEKREEYAAKLSERNEAAAGVKALLAGRRVDEVAAARRAAALDVAAARELVAEMEPYALSVDEVTRRERERELAASRVGELATERDGLAFHLERTAGDPEESLRIEEVLTWLWEAEQSARKRLRVYTLAKEALMEASERMLSSAVPVLGRAVGDTLSSLTGGRYDTVEISESDLSISVYSTEKADMIRGGELMDALSRGTVAQLYLCARLQLVGLLSGGRRPPLIFDDSFSSFDDDRLENLCEVLRDIGTDQQVFIFTCTERYDSLAANARVIDLH